VRVIEIIYEHAESEAEIRHPLASLPRKSSISSRSALLPATARGLNAYLAEGTYFSRRDLLMLAVFIPRLGSARSRRAVCPQILLGPSVRIRILGVRVSSRLSQASRFVTVESQAFEALGIRQVLKNPETREPIMPSSAERRSAADESQGLNFRSGEQSGNAKYQSFKCTGAS